MKLYKYVFLLVLSAVLSLNVFAQENEEMTEEEWQSEINNLTTQRAALKKEFEALNAQVGNLTKTNNDLQSYEDCIDELYKALGATRTDVDNFRRLVESLTRNIDNKQSPKADRQAELDMLKKNKISALPEFFDVVQNQLQRKLDAWEEETKEISYEVVKGDCLWNIAKKEEHYSNPFAWPVIYQANRDQIKNPDLIYPKQIFNIPNLTEEQLAKYEKIKRNYKPAPPAQQQSMSTP